MPFFEREFSGELRRLETGDKVRIGRGGPPQSKAEVDIWGDNLALVSPKGRQVLLGESDKKTGEFKSRPYETLKGRTIVEKRSVTANARRPAIVWKPK